MRRAVFIDRDGVICRNRDDHVKNWEEFEFLPGALKALASLAQSEFSIVVVTNQAIINRRMVLAETVESIHDHMVQAIEEAGGRVDLDVTDEVLAERRARWAPPEWTRLEKGSLLERYRRVVGTAIRGARFE